MHEIVAGNRAPALVSHRSSAKIANKQRELVEDLGETFSQEAVPRPRLDQQGKGTRS